MTIEDLRTIVLSFPGVTEDIKWEHHLCFNVGGKMFMITSPDEVPCSASFKAKEEETEELLSREGFTRQPHLARHNWIYVDDVQRLSKKEWQHYARTSYTQVAMKLSKKLQHSLGLL